MRPAFANSTFRKPDDPRDVLGTVVHDAAEHALKTFKSGRLWVRMSWCRHLARADSDWKDFRRTVALSK